MDTSKRVKIVGDHPHRGEVGTVRDDLPMVMEMWLIDLDQNQMTKGCYAGGEHLRSLPADEDPLV